MILNFIKTESVIISQSFPNGETDLATLALIERWEQEEIDGEFSHFYYDNIQ